ncbi:MAG: hypothetical protein JNL50_03965 [Phycisphaerae bacterium]|nr:hypothetical protein [Phycisphaerae bacterium]
MFKLPSSNRPRSALFRRSRYKRWESAAAKFERYSTNKAKEDIIHATSKLLSCFDDERITTLCQTMLDDLPRGGYSRWTQDKAEMRFLIAESFRGGVIRRAYSWCAGVLFG